MRTALVNVETGAVERVVIAGLGFEPPEGYVAVPSDQANRGDSHDGTAIVAAAPAASPPPPPAVLLGRLARARDAALAVPRSLTIVAPAHAKPVVVQSDATDATMVDLGAMWRKGVVNAAAPIAWDETTVLTGAQAVVLEGIVADYRAAVRLVCISAEAGIRAGTITATAQIDALAWPS